MVQLPPPAGRMHQAWSVLCIGAMAAAAQQQYAAHGRATLRSAGLGAVPAFTELVHTFPLRLLAPHASMRNATAATTKQQPAGKGVGVLYVVSFGGGLVSGDQVSLDVDVGSDTRLLMLTQGSTKVYRERRGGDLPGRIAAPLPEAPVSRQTMRYLVRPGATLVLLADPVTCFARARYSQVQRVDLRCADTSSLVLLDWFTSGRLAVDEGARLPELWHFYLYHSRNEVRANGEVIARDVQWLEQALPGPLRADTPTELARRCQPYTCYATLILFGVETGEVRSALLQEFASIQQSQPLVRAGGSSVASSVRPPEVLWSASPLDMGARGVVVRLASIETHALRSWLRERLKPLRALIGDDLYRVGLGG